MANNLKICSFEYMLSTVNGLGVAQNYLPRVVKEAFLQSTKDGPIQISPDPVTMISGDLSWYNNTGDAQYVCMIVHRAPRSIVAQSPNTVIITDAWTSLISPVGTSADYPSVDQDTMGGRLQIDRPSVNPDDALYGRYFLDVDDSQAYAPVGIVPPTYSFNFRYLAAVQTPNIWVEPTQFTGRWEAKANWTRLTALASPVGGS
jgi:hypothetical protein